MIGLLPTQGDEKRIGSATNLYGTVALSLSSRPGFPATMHQPMSLRVSLKETHEVCQRHEAPQEIRGSVPGFPTSPLSPATTYVVLPKENHMQLTEAATLDRKSGGAEGSAVRHSGAPPLPFQNHSPFVIPTGAEGPAVLRTIHRHVFRRSVPGFPTSPLSPATTYVVLLRRTTYS